MAERLVLPLFLALAITTILPHTATTGAESNVGQLNSFLSSGVLIALESQSSSSSQLVSSAPGNDVQVSTSLLSQNEPSVDLNPLSPTHMVVGANDQTSSSTYWLAIYTSSDSGLTWTSGLIPTAGPLARLQQASDPAVMFSPNGTLYYSGLAFNIQRGNALDGTVFVSRSTDNGASFPRTSIVSTSSGSVFNDKPYLGVDRTTGLFAGRVYVSWTRFASTSTSDIMISYSKDGGVSFSPPIVISNSLLNQGSVPVVGSNGEVYVVWNDLANHEIVEARSSDGGVSFSNPVMVSPYIRLPSYPSSLANSFFRVNNDPTAAADDIAVDVYVAWADYGNGFAQILSSRSTDGGVTWSRPIVVNDDSTSNDHFFPWMTVSHGILSVDWYDRRLDPGNRLIDVFYAESVDGGQTFSSNVKVTDQSSDPGSLNFIGDYIGIVANQTVAHPVWTDLRGVSTTNPENLDIFTERQQINNAPSLIVPGPQTVPAGSKLTFTVSATDPDVPPDTVSITCGNCTLLGASFDPSTDNFTWVPTQSQSPGDYSAVFTATDHLLPQLSDTKTVAIHVDRRVLPPSLAPIGSLSVDDETLLSFRAGASDLNTPPQALTFSLGSDAPAEASISADGTFSWTPTETESGTYSFTVLVSNGVLTDSKMVTVTVVEVEQVPTLTVPAHQTVEIGNLLILGVEATNPDIDDPVTLSASNLPPGASFDPLLGSFAWTPGVNQSLGDYTVVFKAVEPGPRAFSDTKTVTITVEPVSPTPGQPSGFGGLRLELWVVAGAVVLIVVLVTATVIRMGRPKLETSGV